MKIFILSLLFLYTSTRLEAINYYVSSLIGSSSYSGKSPTAPKATIQQASDLTVAGDFVYIMNGTYATSNSAGDIVTVDNSGSAVGGYITYTKYAGHNPLIHPTSWNGFKITNGCSYIIVDGLTIQGNHDNLTLSGALAQPGGCPSVNGTPNAGTRTGTYSSNGIYIDGSQTGGLCHHVIVRNCTVYDCDGGGIASKQSDYLTFENNIVYDNAKYGAFGGSGISNLTPKDFDSNTTDYRIIVRNNISYNNEMLVPWSGYNCEITDGNGIIFDSYTTYAYTGKSLCENNVSFNNGGRGIHVFKSNKIDIINNTCYQNCKSSAITDGDITVRIGDNIKIYNNIISARSGRPTTTTGGTVTNLSVAYNVMFNGTNNLGGTNNVTTDPKFTNAATNDFTILSNSSAINTGSNTAGQYSATDILGTTRPQGVKPDRGAYEMSSVTPVELTSFKGALVNNKAALQWITASEVNVKAFIVEKSSDAKDFTTIATVAARNINAESIYDFDDTQLREGISYYRLKMVDNDGTFKYSNIVSVQSNAKKNGDLTVFPNPVSHRMTVNHTEATEEAMIKILAINGAIVAQYPVSKNASQTTIDAAFLQAGYYFITYVNDGKAVTTKFVK